MIKKFFSVLILFLILNLFFFSSVFGINSQTISLSRPGLSNFFLVTPKIYRGAQPDPEGFRQLKKMGIKKVINLRAFHSDRNETAANHLSYDHLFMKAWHPEDEDVVRFLQMVADPSQQPVFIHCQHGADRTGMMVAVYRIAACGWSKEEAIEEMSQKRFGFHPVWKNLVKYVGQLDVEDLLKKSGVHFEPGDC